MGFTCQGKNKIQLHYEVMRYLSSDHIKHGGPPEPSTTINALKPIESQFCWFMIKICHACLPKSMRELLFIQLCYISYTIVTIQTRGSWSQTRICHVFLANLSWFHICFPRTSSISCLKNSCPALSTKMLKKILFLFLS